MKVVYTVWLRDTSLPPDDPDYEWPACFIVDALDATSGQSWGDHLAKAYAADSAQEFLRSLAEPLEASDLPGLEALPVVPYGHEASRAEIGW